jgi:uncharacterized protein involved in cysteine biosynthesis
VLSAFLKAVDQLGDRRIVRVVGISLAVSAMIFVALWIGTGLLLANMTLFETGWLDTAIDVLGWLAPPVLAWFLFPAVASATIGLFLDDVAAAVEARHYPLLPPARDQPVGEIVATTAKFLAIVLGLNLAVLAFLLVPPLFPFVFYGVNGYLLGREYFELAALRRLTPEEATALRRQHWGKLFVAGLMIALLLTVPLVNLLAPIIGTAAMVHVAEGLRARR